MFNLNQYNLDDMHMVDRIAMGKKHDGKIDMVLTSGDRCSHNVFPVEAAVCIADALSDIASGDDAQFIAADKEDVSTINFRDDDHFMIKAVSEENRVLITSKREREIWCYLTNYTDPAIVALRDVIRMWTA